MSKEQFGLVYSDDELKISGLTALHRALPNTSMSDLFETYGRCWPGGASTWIDFRLERYRDNAEDYKQFHPMDTALGHQDMAILFSIGKVEWLLGYMDYMAENEVGEGADKARALRDRWLADGKNLQPSRELAEVVYDWILERDGDKLRDEWLRRATTLALRLMCTSVDNHAHQEGIEIFASLLNRDLDDRRHYRIDVSDTKALRLRCKFDDLDYVVQVKGK